MYYLYISVMYHQKGICIISWFIFANYNTQKWTLYQPILRQWSLSILPENIKYFQGLTKETSSMKWVKDFFFLVKWRSPHEIAVLLTCTKEFRNGKSHFCYKVLCIYLDISIRYVNIYFWNIATSRFSHLCNPSKCMLWKILDVKSLYYSSNDILFSVEMICGTKV